MNTIERFLMYFANGLKLIAPFVTIVGFIVFALNVLPTRIATISIYVSMAATIIIFIGYISTKFED